VQMRESLRNAQLALLDSPDQMGSTGKVHPDEKGQWSNIIRRHRVALTGHSLGGALAVLNTLALKNKGLLPCIPSKSVSTFGGGGFHIWCTITMLVLSS
jgi:hypothetical protein